VLIRNIHQNGASMFPSRHIHPHFRALDGSYTNRAKAAVRIGGVSLLDHDGEPPAWGDVLRGGDVLLGRPVINQPVLRLSQRRHPIMTGCGGGFPVDIPAEPLLLAAVPAAVAF